MHRITDARLERPAVEKFLAPRGPEGREAGIALIIADTMVSGAVRQDSARPPPRPQPLKRQHFHIAHLRQRTDLGLRRLRHALIDAADSDGVFAGAGSPQ